MGYILINHSIWMSWPQTITWVCPSIPSAGILWCWLWGNRGSRRCDWSSRIMKYMISTSAHIRTTQFESHIFAFIPMVVFSTAVTLTLEQYLIRTSLNNAKCWTNWIKEKSLNTSAARRLIFCLYKSNFLWTLTVFIFLELKILWALRYCPLPCLLNPVYWLAVVASKKSIALYSIYRRWWRYFSWIHTCLKNKNPFYLLKSLF